ncbi:MAG: AAC(3) family N-acetyltransferase [Gammaproteobacteria bacterium]|nr:AAC(3) family N-acetyltransferase [Gammaproteobacteria bacterium]
MQKEQFQRALYEIGLQPGDVAFMHSSHEHLAALGMPALQIIESLCAAVGERGTVAMPTFPKERLFHFLKEDRDLDQHPVFDCQRTPSYSGLLTELFRRLPGTERSLHPTHPIAAHGADADWITADHQSGHTPFDKVSPFQKLLERDACIVRIGRFKQGAMTIRHLADHMFQQYIPYPVYSRTAARVRVIDKHGLELTVSTRVLNQDISCNHLDLIDVLTKEGLMATTSVVGVPLSLIHAETYINAYHSYYKQGLIRHYPRSKTQHALVERTMNSRGGSLKQRLKAILVEQASDTVRENDIHDNMSLYGIGLALDSVGIVSLVSRLESEFDVFFESEEIAAGLDTFGAFLRVIQKKLHQNQDYSQHND